VTLAASSPLQPGTSHRARDFVFTFSYESYADAHKRGMMRPPDRLVSTLIDSPEVRRVLVADPFRSWITSWVRALVDIRHRARETDKFRHVSPMRIARADPVHVDDVAAVYRDYERIVRRAAEAAQLEQPAFVTASPLVGGFTDLDWTGGALYYARDDWLSSPARRRYWPAYREAYRQQSSKRR